MNSKTAHRISSTAVLPRTRGVNTNTPSAAAIARTLAACAYLSISRSTLHRLVKNGKLKPVQIGPRAVGYSYADLDAFIACAVA